MNSVRSIAIVGYGHVGRAFASFFKEKGVEDVVVAVRQVSTELRDQLPKGVSVVDDLSQLEKVDLVVVCVRDEAVAQVINALPVHVPVAYTSGSIQLNELSAKHRVGVFYPLQSFAGISVEHVQDIPILIEARDAELLAFLRQFGLSYFNRVEEMSSAQRAKLHVAAVMVNNFTNHLFTLAHEWTRTHDLDFSLLIPLIQETVEKIRNHSPDEVQTGPAMRGDSEVVQRQLEQLDGRTKELYRLFSDSIVERKNSHKID
jgi:predicted short-subunit dehydrogenase-like oxidoreductase (DUF2520 family)